MPLQAMTNPSMSVFKTFPNGSLAAVSVMASVVSSVVYGMVASVVVSSLLAGCGENSQPDQPEPDAEWAMVFDGDELGATLFSVWGEGKDDIWTVGADNGTGPMVLHFDGENWRRVETDGSSAGNSASGNLWWVSGQGDSIWMTGDDGMILRYSRADDEFEVMQAPEPVTVYGVMPFAEDDVWAVGGDVEQSLAYVFHYDGEDWLTVDDLPEEAQSDAWFKVWGTGPDDLWIVGFSDWALRREGDEWTALPVPSDSRLFTVHGNGQLTVAVGGFVSALIVESADDELVDVTPEPAPLQLNGVFVERDGHVLAAGDGASVWERTADGTWQEVEDLPENFYDYHAVFVDPDGDAWAVGGRIITEPFDLGLLAHRGSPISDVIE